MSECGQTLIVSPLELSGWFGGVEGLVTLEREESEAFICIFLPWGIPVIVHKIKYK